MPEKEIFNRYLYAKECSSQFSGLAMEINTPIKPITLSPEVAKFVYIHFEPIATELAKENDPERDIAKRIIAAAEINNGKMVSLTVEKREDMAAVFKQLDFELILAPHLSDNEHLTAIKHDYLALLKILGLEELFIEEDWLERGFSERISKETISRFSYFENASSKNGRVRHLWALAEGYRQKILTEERTRK